MKKYNLTLFGVKETTKIIAEYLVSKGIKIDLIISIDASLIATSSISDYANLKLTAQSIDAEYYPAKEYSLKQLKDTFFLDNEFELGLVYGWQRLIPKDIIAKFSKGIFGFHASPDLLPKGRGRSPLNWGIILGKTTMYNHLFRYALDPDAGAIYSVTKFAINPNDTILTVLYKSLVIAKKELLRLIHDSRVGELPLTPQKGEPYFFAKRTSEDGLISFNTSSTKDIINLIRGVTKPFPGAFCYTNFGKKIIIWEAWEFDSYINFSGYIPGEVIDNLYHMPIIKTKESSIILKNYEGASLKPGEHLTATPDKS